MTRWPTWWPGCRSCRPLRCAARRRPALATFEYGVSLETQSQLTRDHEEAVQAFIDKRAPQYQGR